MPCPRASLRTLTATSIGVGTDEVAQAAISSRHDGGYGLSEMQIPLSTEELQQEFNKATERIVAASIPPYVIAQERYLTSGDASGVPVLTYTVRPPPARGSYLLRHSSETQQEPINTDPERNPDGHKRGALSATQSSLPYRCQTSGADTRPHQWQSSEIGQWRMSHSHSPVRSVTSWTSLSSA